MGQYDAANAQYDGVIQLGQAHLGRFGMGLVQLERGQPQDALVSFQHALQINPNMVGVKYHAARAHEKLGNVEPARKLYETFMVEAGSLVRERESVEKARERLTELSKR
jgi:Tfp pilus assembly protein PilF